MMISRYHLCIGWFSVSLLSHSIFVQLPCGTMAATTVFIASIVAAFAPQVVCYYREMQPDIAADKKKALERIEGKLEAAQNFDILVRSFTEHDTTAMTKFNNPWIS